MTKEFAASPVYREALAAHYNEVQSFQAARARSAKSRGTVAIAVAGVLLLANAAQAWTIASMLPLTKIVPVYLWVRHDGSVDSSVTLSRLPATQAQAVIDAALWEYVRLREGYSYDSARYGYDAVSGMSADAVRDSYQRWFNYPNPASPQVTVGQKGQIDIERIGIASIAADVVQIRYQRRLAMTGEQPVVTTWTATLQFKTATSLPAAERLTNPGGVIVTSYQAEEDGAP
jgi:type IV secretion system protein VirB8